MVPCTSQKLSQSDIYVINTWEWVYLYIGSQVPDEFIQILFGFQNFSDMKFNHVTYFQPLETPESQALSGLIEQIRAEKTGSYAPLKLLMAGDASESESLQSFLVEDSTNVNKEFPYSDFLCMLHRLIRHKS